MREPLEGNMTGSLKPEAVFTRQQRIAELAKQSREFAFLSLNHYLDLYWLEAAYARTRKDGAVGVDGQTAAEYAAHLEENLQSLLDRAQSGTYRAPPVRRVYISKRPGSQETRPLGIPTFEDKVLQRAVAMLLEPIYEQNFMDCSYGFRPGRSAHQALGALREGLMQFGGGWILDVDIRKFFDTLQHGCLRELLRQRIRDGVVLRLIGKWLNAGVWEDGTLTHPGEGTPQGGVISPLLSNVYLHYVLDVWFEQEVKPRLAGRAFLIRFADDFVIVFQHEADARRVLEVLPKRFAKFGLTLHPEKTRLVGFVRPHRVCSTPAAPSAAVQNITAQALGTFDLLGFTHYWGYSRNGYWVVKRKTARSRLRRAILAASEWCRRNLHQPVAEQHRTLCQKLRGHFAYYGITGNSWSLSSFREAVTDAWRKWLSRRNRDRPMTWVVFTRLLEHYPLPMPRIVHDV
jgi:group II intron reverse transcriptase/maturase